MLVKPLVHFSTTTLGVFEPGTVAEIPDNVAQQFIAKGYVEEVKMEIKPKSDEFPKELGAAKESSLPQADPALQKKPAAKRARKSTK